MGLTGIEILNRNASVQETALLNGISKQLNFVSSGFCKFDDSPEGCVVFSLKDPLPRPSLKRRVDDAPVSRPQLTLRTESPKLSQNRLFANGTNQHVDTPRPTQNRPLLCNGSDRHVDTPRPTQKRPFVNGIDRHVDTPRPIQKRSFDNGFDHKFESSEPVQKRPYTNGAEQRVETPKPTQKELFTNGYGHHVDTPRPLQKKLLINGIEQHAEPSRLVQKRLSTNGSGQNSDSLSFNWKGLDIARLDHALGLNNSRNDCFINSVLQFVFHTPQLVRYIINCRDKHKCSDETRCIYCTLFYYYKLMCTREQAFTAVKLREIVNSQFPNRIPNNQEDAHEMLIFLLSKLEPPLPKKNGMMSSEPRPKPPATTEIDRIFGGKLKYKTKCHECNYSQGNSEQFRELNLNLSTPANQFQPVRLEDYIENYFKTERLNDYKCDKCGKKNSVRHPCIEVPPNILIIQLKRFRYNGSKNHVEIVFPLGLNLSKFGSDKEQGLQYRLYGFISHSGVSANSGHYKATMFGYNKQWYQFDDEYVSKAEPSRFDQRQPYLLFYHKAPPSLQVPRSSAVFNLNNQNSNKSSPSVSWNSNSSIKRPLVDKHNTQNGHSQRNGYHESNGSSAYQPIFKKPGTNGYHNGDSNRWNMHGNHSMNGNKNGMSFSYEKFHPQRN